MEDRDPSLGSAAGQPLTDSDRITLQFEKFSSFVEEYASYLSLGGMFLATPTVRPVGDTIDFLIELTDGFLLIQGVGEVVWVRETGTDYPAGLGLRFQALDEKGRELILKILEEQVRSGGVPFDVDDIPEDALTAGAAAAPTPALQPEATAPIETLPDQVSAPEGSDETPQGQLEFDAPWGKELPAVPDEILEESGVMARPSAEELAAVAVDPPIVEPGSPISVHEVTEASAEVPVSETPTLETASPETALPETVSPEILPLETPLSASTAVSVESELLATNEPAIPTIDGIDIETVADSPVAGDDFQQAAEAALELDSLPELSAVESGDFSEEDLGLEFESVEAVVGDAEAQADLAELMATPVPEAVDEPIPSFETELPAVPEEKVAVPALAGSFDGAAEPREGLAVGTDVGFSSPFAAPTVDPTTDGLDPVPPAEVPPAEVPVDFQPVPTAAEPMAAPADPVPQPAPSATEGPLLDYEHELDDSGALLEESSPRRKPSRALVAVAALALLGAFGWWQWGRTPPPPPPAVATVGGSPVAELGPTDVAEEPAAEPTASEPLIPADSNEEDGGREASKAQGPAPAGAGASDLSGPATAPAPTSQAPRASTLERRRSASASASASVVRDISWRREARGTLVTILLDGETASGRVRHDRLDWSREKEQLSLVGIQLPYLPATVDVATSELVRIRTGLHSDAGASELRLVFDLGASAAGLETPRVAADRVSVLVLRSGS